MPAAFQTGGRLAFGMEPGQCDTSMAERMSVDSAATARRRVAAVAAAMVMAVLAGACGSSPPAGGRAAPSTATVAPATGIPAPPTTTAAPTAAPPTTTAAPPTTVACDQPLQVGNDGSVAPLRCGSGQVNTAALRYYRGGNPGHWYPTVLELPASAIRAQVVAAMCHDIGPGQPWPSGVQTEQQAYQLAAQLNGWSYGLNVVQDDSACS